MEVSAARTSIADVPNHTVEPAPAPVLNYLASRLGARDGLGHRVAESGLVARVVAGDTTHGATTPGKTAARASLEVLTTFRGPTHPRWEITWPVTGGGAEPHPGLVPRVPGIFCATPSDGDTLAWDGMRSFWPDSNDTLGAAVRWALDGANAALDERIAQGGGLLVVVEALVRQRRLDTLSALTRGHTNPRAGLILRAASWRAGAKDAALEGLDLARLSESDWTALGCNVVRAGDLVLALQCVAAHRPIDPAALDTGAP